MSKNPLIRGTIILTVAGLITRVLGFFYRIFLADALGSEALGIYQLVFPVSGLCYTLFAAGNQTALSRMVAAHDLSHHRRLFSRTLLLSLATSLILGTLLLILAPFIAEQMLFEVRSTNSLRILAISFPFCAITACINGLYYGHKKSAVPAATQFIEQVTRMAVVYFFVRLITTPRQIPFTCEMAMLGLLAGEITSMATGSIAASTKLFRHLPSSPTFPVYSEFFRISLPITGNRFTISLLHSIETILLPTFLRLAGYSDIQALSLYGILNGMAMPFLLFPSTVTNSLSVMLLPAVADASAGGRTKSLAHTIETGLRYSLLVSILCTGIFLIYGKEMGTLFFHNDTAGDYIRILSWLCPFLYLNTTLGSILNGLDLAPTVFLQNVVASSLRILFLLLFVPQYGMTGYLLGMLAGALCLTLMHTWTLQKKIHCLAIPFHMPFGLMVISVLDVCVGLWISKQLPLSFLNEVNGLIPLFFRCLFVCFMFLPLVRTPGKNSEVS